MYWTFPVGKWTYAVSRRCPKCHRFISKGKLVKRFFFSRVTAKNFCCVEHGEVTPKCIRNHRRHLT